MTSPIPILDTDRLRLRPFVLEDAPTVQWLASDAEVAATTLNIPHPYPDGLAAAWISGHGAAAERGVFTWAIVRRAGAALMGSITLSVNAQHRRAELGYWLGVPFWNQGYMTEAAHRVTVYGFEQLGLHRVQAACFPRNVASARVMEKAGLRYEGVLRGYARKGDTFEGIAMYAILVTDVEG